MTKSELAKTEEKCKYFKKMAEKLQKEKKASKEKSEKQALRIKDQENII